MNELGAIAKSKGCWEEIPSSRLTDVLHQGHTWVRASKPQPAGVLQSSPSMGPTPNSISREKRNVLIFSPCNKMKKVRGEL